MLHTGAFSLYHASLEVLFVSFPARFLVFLFFLCYFDHVSVVVCFLLCLISCLFVKYWTKKQAAASPPRMENIYFCSVFVPSPNWPKPHQQ